jgi:fibronectin-binding autotransporter adhesin
LDLFDFSASVNGLSGSGLVASFKTNLTGGPTLTVGNNNATSTFDGVIQNGDATAVALTKTGSGTLSLTGSNTYTGPTSVNAGTLMVNGSLGNTAVTVGGGATLGGTGSIAGSVVVAGGSTAATQGTVSLADGTIGTLTLSDSNAADIVLTVGGTAGNPSALTFEVGTSGDRIQIAAGKLAVQPGGATINIVPLSGFGPGTYDLIDVPNGQIIGLGNFTLATPYLSGYRLSLQQTPTSEQLVVVVPEPSTLALLAAGALGLLGCAWRRRD